MNGSNEPTKEEIDQFFANLDVEDDGEELVPETKAESNYKRYNKEEKLRLYDRMLELKYRKRLSWDEIAAKFKVARSTIRDWRQTDEWRLAEARWRRTMREEARSDATLMGQDALGVLADLMHNAKSEFTRYSAAAKVVDLVGIGDETIEQLTDETSKLSQWLETGLRRKDLQIARLKAGGLNNQEELLALEVKPGGLVPDQISKMNDAMAEEKRLEREGRENALEAEFVEVPSQHALDDVDVEPEE